MSAVRESTASRLAGLTLAGIASLVLASFAFSVATGAGAGGADTLFAFVMLSFPAVGALIVRRQPRNSIGWIMLAVGVVWGVVAVLDVYARYALVFDPGSLPGPEVALALSAPAWVAFIGLPGFLILLFPDGRLPSPRWRWWAWLCAITLVWSYLAILIGPDSFAESGYPGIQNPLGIDALEPFWVALVAPIALIPICVVGCAVALVGRFRRSHGVARLQLKWLALGAGVTAALYLLAMAITLPLDAAWDSSGPLWLSLLQNVAFSSLALIPIAIGVAILRHRLYDIDVIVNRALVYGVLSATLGLSYLGVVVILQQLLRPFTSGSDLAIAGSTLAVAALFRPFRARIQAAVDRRFFRRSYDASRTLDAFSARLRDTVDLDALGSEIEAVVRETMQPAHVSLWLRVGGKPSGAP